MISGKRSSRCSRKDLTGICAFFFFSFPFSLSSPFPSPPSLSPPESSFPSSASALNGAGGSTMFIVKFCAGAFVPVRLHRILFPLELAMDGWVGSFSKDEPPTSAGPRPLLGMGFQCLYMGGVLGAFFFFSFPFSVSFSLPFPSFSFFP